MLTCTQIMMTSLHTKALYMDDFNGDIRQVDCTQTVFVGDAGGRLRVSTQTNKPPPPKKKRREDYDSSAFGTCARGSSTLRLFASVPGVVLCRGLVVLLIGNFCVHFSNQKQRCFATPFLSNQRQRCFAPLSNQRQRWQYAVCFLC